MSVASAKAEPDRRQASRHPTEAGATLHSPHGDLASILLADVSTHGCSIKGEFGWLRPGSFVSIGYADEPLLPAIVRWIRGEAAGMEFLQPIPATRARWHALMNSSSSG